MSEDIFTEYGGQKSLQEVIEELALHCMSVTGRDANFKIMLPKAVVDRFNSSFAAKGKVTQLPEGRIKTMYVTSGVCSIYDTEDYAVVKVEK